MKFLVIFAAVLLTINAAKVPPMSEETLQIVTPIQPVQEDIAAVVVEVAKDHVVTTEVTPIVSTTTTTTVVNNVVAPIEDVGAAVKVPLTQNPQVPEILLTQVPEVKPLVETPMLAELTVALIAPTETPADDTTEVTTIVTETEKEETKKIADPSRCDLQCTKLELDPICAVNLDCIHEFPNHCVMETYNCLHPNKVFKEVKDERCKMHWLKKCTEKEMMED